MNQQSTSRLEAELYAEHSDVKLKEDAVFDGRTLPAGSRGAIVSVYPEHRGYTVEFTSENHSLLVDVLHQQVELDRF